MSCHLHLPVSITDRTSFFCFILAAGPKPTCLGPNVFPMAKVRAQWSWSATAVKAVVVEGCGRGICQHQFRVCLLHIVILGLFPLYLFFHFFPPSVHYRLQIFTSIHYRLRFSKVCMKMKLLFMRDMKKCSPVMQRSVNDWVNVCIVMMDGCMLFE